MKDVDEVVAAMVYEASHHPGMAADKEALKDLVFDSAYSQLGNSSSEQDIRESVDRQVEGATFQ